MRKLTKIICAAILIGALSGTPAAIGLKGGAAPVEPEVAAVSAYAVEQTTGTPIYAKNENERRPIASMAKIMTLTLTFEEIDAGRLSMDESVSISERAAGMGGSQAFLDAGNSYKAEDLIGSAIIASANDSCVALAERIAGSVEGFVSRMNDRAAELGMANTHFVNCTGLPAPDHFSCAKDVAVMSRQLFSHEAYYGFSETWMKDFIHPSGRVTGLTNTNRLIRSLNGCDGGKTGYTREAGFCISATAKREGMRLIGVVMGETDSKVRFSDAAKLVNYGFANYAIQSAVKAGDPFGEIRVTGGKINTVSVQAASDVSAFGSKTDRGEIETTVDLPATVAAPVKKGDVLGKVYVSRGGQVVGETDLVASCDAGVKTFGDAWHDIISRF